MLEKVHTRIIDKQKEDTAERRHFFHEDTRAAERDVQSYQTKPAGPLGLQ